MKSVSLLAAALLIAGAANAQTNTYMGPTIRPVTTPLAPENKNAEVVGAKPGGWAPEYTAYSQDSYVNQVGSGNNATVNQSDNRSSKADGGSTAILDQIGNHNTANQSQYLKDNAFSNVSAGVGGRNIVKATQLGDGSQSDQTQSGGGYNAETVVQGEHTTGNRAIQTQTIDGSGAGAGNQATIVQTQYNNAGGYGNRAVQAQSGYNQVARIEQESTNSFASQTQSGGSFDYPLNTAFIKQGSPGDANTAMQKQSGSGNAASIKQSFGSNASGNYALQDQSGTNNQATIVQESNKNYAVQMQEGSENRASTLQQNVSSASYITQNGMANMATVTQK